VYGQVVSISKSSEHEYWARYGVDTARGGGNNVRGPASEIAHSAESPFFIRFLFTFFSETQSVVNIFGRNDPPYFCRIENGSIASRRQDVAIADVSCGQSKSSTATHDNLASNAGSKASDEGDGRSACM
jgi:hypothetical protein